MTSRLIADVTATLTGNSITERTVENETHAPSRATNTSANNSAFGKYNKQMLISSYLNRGRDTGTSSLDPKAKTNDATRSGEVEPESAGPGPREVIPPGNPGDSRMRKERREEVNPQASLEEKFRDLFGESVNIPNKLKV
ncbi:hypothetical protein DFH28DRAFT_928800 [Melampsora americana]|nr:hypothetical protein DFH28DRAFT_928800 [Melampsora americana]